MTIRTFKTVAFAFAAASGLALAAAAQAADQVAVSTPGERGISCQAAIADTERSLTQTGRTLANVTSDDEGQTLSLQYDIAKQACANGDPRTAFSYLSVIRSQLNLAPISG